MTTLYVVATFNGDIVSDVVGVFDDEEKAWEVAKELDDKTYPGCNDMPEFDETGVFTLTLNDPQTYVTAQDGQEYLRRSQIGN